MEEDQRFNAIVEAVGYWLGYQFKIGREQLVHEASLRYPIADTLTAKGVAIDRIELEKLHPLFKSKKIDLVIYGESDSEPTVIRGHDDSNLSEVYEFKLAKYDTAKEFGAEHQRVFDDLLRLAYYNLWEGKQCYFLMCGKYEDFKTYFVGQERKLRVGEDENQVELVENQRPQNPRLGVGAEWNSRGLYRTWFSFQVNGTSKETFRRNDSATWGLSSFEQDYLIRDKVDKKHLEEITVQTTCLAITPPGLELIRTHAAGIWKIEGFLGNEISENRH